MNARTLQALTGERPSTIQASTKRIVTVERTTKVVAVKWTSGSKDCHIRPSKSTITSARKQSKGWFISSRRFRIKKRCKPTWSKIARSVHPASSQRKMIYSMGNMEYFEICEITPNIQCPNCMTHWTKGIVYCICGTCWRPSDKVRKLNSDRYDVLSIPNYVIKKRPSQGARHGNTERQRIHHAAHVSSKKAQKRSATPYWIDCYRQAQIDIGWTEEHCARLDEIAAEDHFFFATAAERTKRLGPCAQSHVYIVLPHTYFSRVASDLSQHLCLANHSTRTFNPIPSLFLLRGDDHCDDPQYVATCGPLAEPQLLTSRDPCDTLWHLGRLRHTPLCNRMIDIEGNNTYSTKFQCNGLCVNTTPQMTCFRGAIVCTKWLQERIDDQSIQPDNKLELGTSYKLKLGPRWNWDQKWKIKNWPWMRGDTARCVHQWQHDHFHSHIVWAWRALSSSFLSVHRHAHMHRGSSNESFTPSTWSHSRECFSSPLLSLSTSRTSWRTPYLSSCTWSSQTTWTCCALRTKRVWTLLTSSSSPQVMSPTPTTSRRPQSSPTQSSWTRHHSSPTKSLLRTPTTMTLHSRICFAKHTEHMPITLYEKTCLSVCRRRQCPIERGDPLETERDDPLSKEIQEAQIRTLLDKQKEQILAECQARINKHEAAYDRRSLLKLGEIVNSQQRELHLSRAEEVQQRDQQLHQGQLLQQNLELREAHQRSLTEMEELRKFQSSTFDTIARRKLVEEQNTILDLSGRTQELQNEINCMSDSKDFQDAESSRSGNSHVTSRPVSFPPHPIPEGMLRHSFVSLSRREGPPSIWDTHGFSGNVFVNPDASSSAPYPQELRQWNSSIEEPLQFVHSGEKWKTRTK